MRKGLCVGVACVLVAAAATAFSAQAANQLWEEYDKLVSKRQAVGTLGPDLFGDQLSFYSGTLTFSQTDVSLQGNFSLPVAITRTLSIEAKRGYPNPSLYINDAPMGDWDLDLPHISGVFGTTQGWVGANGSAASRCSQPAPPRPVVFSSGNSVQAVEFWHGYQLHIPGGGGELLAASSSGGEILASPTGRTRPGLGGPYYWLTSDWTYLSCLPTLANAPTQGQGFLATTADGTKYRFDWMAAFHEPQVEKKRESSLDGEDVLSRRRLALYATSVQDRFGNSVTYTYTNAPDAPIRLSRIDASDGRSIVLQPNAYGQVARITAGTQEWTYEYEGLGSMLPALTGVVQPDLRRWSFDVAGLSGMLRYEGGQAGDQLRTCMSPGGVISPSHSGTITHPSGAIGEFTVSPTRFGRSNVLAMCKNVTTANPVDGTDPNNEADDVAVYPIAWDSLALTRKRISGPGLATAEWNYAYDSQISWFYSGGGSPGNPVCVSGGCLAPQCVVDSCALVSVTTVDGPGQRSRSYTFGNSYRYNEGKLLSVVDYKTGTTVPLRTEKTTYQLATSGQPFPTPLGISPQTRSGAAFTSEYLRPQLSSTITQQGIDFKSQVNSYDRFARPLSVTKFSSLGCAQCSRTDATAYHHDLSKWVIGQVQSVTTSTTNPASSVVQMQTDYDLTTVLPIRHYAFGKLQQTLTYELQPGTPQTGTLATVSDGRDSLTFDTTIELQNWHRGIPQLIKYPSTPDQLAGESESAMVDIDGWIRSTTDENGYTTHYDYDAMGRLDKMTYPVGDGVAWNDTNLDFSQLPVQHEYGLPANHWHQLMHTGTGYKVIHYDALLQPVVEDTYDAADPGNTRSLVVKRYDAAGRLVFQSYPVRTLGNYADATLKGVTTEYDALDRVTKVSQSAEPAVGGVVQSTTRYLPGFSTEVTDPEGNVTTTSYMAHDQPTHDYPVQIAMPEGVTTVISRDVFGDPLQLQRVGSED